MPLKNKRRQTADTTSWIGFLPLVTQRGEVDYREVDQKDYETDTVERKGEKVLDRQDHDTRVGRHRRCMRSRPNHSSDIVDCRTARHTCALRNAEYARRDALSL